MSLRKSILLGSASALVMVATAASAQNAATEELEEIVVTGIRGGLMQSLRTKRNSNAIVDAISSEDIGKFPDKNVAESLQRVTGVVIERQFGEGQGVSIRGASQNMTLTTLNGQNVASTGWFVFEPARRSFNYSLLPSELVGNIEVYKSAQADLPEGGIGGTVVINTRRPLDMDELNIYGSIEGAHTNDSDKIDPQISGMASWKNEAGNVGLLVSGVYQRRQMQRQGNEAFWAWGAGPVAFDQDRKRSAVNATLEFEPNDNLNLAFNFVRMQMRADNTNYALWLTRGEPDGGVASADLQNGSPIRGPLNVAFYQARPREATMKSHVYDFDAKYEGDGYVVDFQVGKTTSSGGTDFEMALNDGLVPSIANSTYDFSSGSQKWNLSEIGFSSYDPGTLNMGTGPNFNRTPKVDKEFYVQGDVTYDVDWGVVNSLKTGFRYSDHHTDSLRFEFTQTDGFETAIATSTINDGLINVGADDIQIMRINADAAKDWAKASITGETEDLGAHSEVDEKNTSAYVMADFEGDGFRGNAGVRYTHTSATSTYYINGELTTTDASYSQLLPSFNIAVDMSDDLILRASAARVMTRPQYVDMYVNPRVAGADDDLPNNQSWTIGNVGLKPFVANQFDLSLEWYFAEGSILSAAVFLKDVKNFVTSRSTRAAASEIPFNLALDDERAYGWDVHERMNGSAGELKGFEVQYQQDFQNGFGAILNYTYTDSNVDDSSVFNDANTMLSDASKHSANVSGYYENDDFQVRVSYNYRSEYMIRENPGYGSRLHKGFGTVDMSARWFVTDQIAVNLDVNNLFEPSAKQIGNNVETVLNAGFNRGFPAYEYATARRITLGVSFKY